MVSVLFLSQVLPFPLDSGARIRAYYVLRQLASQHQVTLVSFVRSDDRVSSMKHLRSICFEVHTVLMRRTRMRDGLAFFRSLLTTQPMVIVRDEIREMQNLVSGLMREHTFDVVHADQTAMAQYGLLARAASSSTPRTILDVHNALHRVPERLAERESLPWTRWLLQREATLLQRYEIDIYNGFDQLVFVADEDRQALALGMRSWSDAPDSDRRYTTIPICVDTSEPVLATTSNCQRNVVHIGTMFWPPNIEGVLWFGREVWPRVTQRVPDAQFTIIGKNPPREVFRLAEERPNIHVTGYVPDPLPLLRGAAAFVVPLHSAGGMRVKILEAWRLGLPVITTSVGVEGIEARDGEHLLTADSADGFAEAVANTILDRTSATQLGLRGRHWVEEKYDWRRVYSRWDVVYNALLEG